MKINDVLNSVITFLFLNSTFVAIVLSVYVFITVLVFFILNKKNKISGKKNVLFLVLLASCIFFQTSVSIENTTLLLSSYILFLGVNGFCLIYLPEKKRKEKPEKAEEVIYSFEPTEEKKEELKKSVLPEVVKKTVNKESKPKEEIDFSHVKNVISHLEGYDITVADRKILTRLKTNVLIAESGGLTPRVKSDINDGLCSVLKIMSKYKV